MTVLVANLVCLPLFLGILVNANIHAISPFMPTPKAECCFASYDTHFSSFTQLFAIWGEGLVITHQSSWLVRQCEG